MEERRRRREGGEDMNNPVNEMTKERVRRISVIRISIESKQSQQHRQRGK
jgi:hypothetical protein